MDVFERSVIRVRVRLSGVLSLNHLESGRTIPNYYNCFPNLNYRIHSYRYNGYQMHQATHITVLSSEFLTAVISDLLGNNQ